MPLVAACVNKKMPRVTKNIDTVDTAQYDHIHTSGGVTRYVTNTRDQRIARDLATLASTSGGCSSANAG